MRRLAAEALLDLVGWLVSKAMIDPGADPSPFRESTKKPLDKGNEMTDNDHVIKRDLKKGMT